MGAAAKIFQGERPNGGQQRKRGKSGMLSVSRFPNPRQAKGEMKK
jgi:hypothetical protein